MCLVRAVIQRERGDVAPRVRDPPDRRHEEHESEDRDQDPGQRDAHDGERQRRCVEQRDDARGRHVDLFPDGRSRAALVEPVIAHWMYTKAATKVRANMRTPTMLAKKAVRRFRRASLRSIGRPVYSESCASSTIARKSTAR